MDYATDTYAPDDEVAQADEELGATVHAVSPRKAKVDRLFSDENGFSIEVARSGAAFDAASIVLNDRYGWRGYGIGHTIARHLHSHTFLARSYDLPIGTITLQVDSDGGLAADATFKDLVDDLRAKSACLCELKRFAFDTSSRSKEQMAALFHAVFAYGTAAYRSDRLLIEVNTRHVRFYEAMLGFRRVAGARPHATLGIDVVLMELSVTQIDEGIEAKRGSAVSARSLYRYFLAPNQELQFDLACALERAQFALDEHCSRSATAH